MSFILLCTGRSGSTMLQRALDSHAGIGSCGELYDPAELSGTYNDAKGVIGCKLNYLLPRVKWAEADWSWLIEHNEIDVIWLDRNDKLAQFASERIANITGAWDHPAADRPTITVDPGHFERWKYHLSQRRRQVGRMMAAHRQTVATYEQLCDEWDATIGRLERFIGVAQEPLHKLTERGETRPISDVIDNYCELTPTTPPIQ